MATLQQLKTGIGDAWNNVVEGWRRLTERASSALTRFSLPGSGKRDKQELANVEERSVGWGVLAAEVYDDDSRVVVRVEAPGMRKEDFNIQVVDDYLVVRGEKRVERESVNGSYHILECAYGSFERALPLPGPVEEAGATATYKNGVLKVELPKKQAEGVRAIPIS